MIDVLEIREKQKTHPLAVASPEDFACDNIGTADPSLVVSDPTISLYCLDHAARRALFVQVPPGVDITAAPFLYMAQYDHARRVLAVPYDVLHRIAAGIELRIPLVFIHSTGRAGSTLMSKAFGEMEAVTSLSEPDVYTQAVALRLDGGRDGEIQDLLASATRVLFNPAFMQGASLCVVKFRSFCAEVGDLLSAAFPSAGNLFLYRDLDAYIRSTARAFAVDDMPPEVRRMAATALAQTTPLLAEELRHRPDLDGAEITCLIWLSAIHAYARLHQHGIPILAVRYEELVEDPPRMMGTILAHLGLSLDRVGSALHAFERDAQAGSPISREEAARHAVQIDSHQWNLVRELVQRYPLVGADLPAPSVNV